MKEWYQGLESYKPSCTVEELMDFEQSKIWREIVDTINCMIFAATEAIQQVDTLEDLRRIQGKLEAMENLKVLPMAMRNELIKDKINLGLTEEDEDGTDE